MQAAQGGVRGSGGVFSQEAPPVWSPRLLGRGQEGGENEPGRVKIPSPAAVRTPCASWQKFVELRSHELSKSQSTQAHASPWTRATPQDVHVLRHISFATSPAPLPSTPEAEGANERVFRDEPSLAGCFDDTCGDSNPLAPSPGSI